MAADQTVKEWQSVSVSIPVKATLNDIIVLSDSDEEDVNIEVTSARRKEVESPDINIWHCSGICGSGTRSPVSLSALKRWSEFEFDSSSSHLEFKVWKTGESEREAMSLRDALKLSQDDPMPTLLEESNSDCQTLNPANCGLPQPSNIIFDADVECKNQSANMAADQTVKEWQSVSVYVPVKVTINDIIVLSDSDEEDVNIEVTSAGRKEVESPDINILHCSGIYGSGTRRPVSLSTLKRWSESEFDTSSSHLEFKTVKEWQSVSVSIQVKATINDIIVLSDSDEEDVNIEVTSAGRKKVESPDINIWHCSGICGSGTRRPVSLTALKRWSESEFDSSSSHLDFKVWKTGESEREAMSLRDALKLSPYDPMPTLLEESNSDCQTLNPANCGLPQPSNIISDADVECRNQSANMAADQTVKEWQSVSVSVPVKATINDIIVLSDTDEEDVNIEVTSAGIKEVESPDINIWHCSGIYGSRIRRPVSLSALKRWSESEFDSSSSHLEFKVWKTGESEREAMSLRDALKLNQDDPIPTLLEESNSDCQTLNPANCGLPQPSNIISDANVECRNQSANIAADQTVKEWQGVSVSVPIKATINDIIVLSDTDEEDVNIEVTSAGIKEVESPDINIWHYSGICGSGTRRPVSLTALKRWSDSEFDSSSSHLEFKTLNPANCGLPQPSNIIFDADVECKNQNANMAADQTVKEWQSVSVYVPVKVTINDIIVLSDSNEEDVNIEVTSAGRKEVESPDINIWHCSGIYGSGTRRPVSLSALKRWSESEFDSSSSHLEFKVWKIGESEREAMSLRDALKLSQDDPMPTLLKESNSDCQTLNPANCGLPQPSNIIFDADVECKNQNANMAADQTVKEWQSVSVYVPVKVTINDIIVISDSNEEDVNIEVTSAGRKEVESPDINIWHCSGIYGSGTRRPVSLSALKRWSESEFDSSSSHLEFKVWKTGESEREAMSLRDALKLSQDDPMPTLLKESNSDCHTLNPANCGLPQPIKEWKSVSVSIPVKATINDIIVLSDSDEEDVNIEVTSAGTKEVESPDINIWHCSGICGSGTRSPVSLSALKRWSEFEFDSSSSHLEFKVWKTGESEREAMSLRDALKLSQDDLMPTLLEESNSDCQTLNPANCGLPQPSNIIFDADVECKNQSANMAADQTVKEWQSVSVYVPVKVTINDIIVFFLTQRYYCVK
ncbi:unnamed protein product [Trifolium pratense]|uniref:Uncharacterized protein n=1 Tax=Trifolium pratense TaxID=57577 RepID=A0ACB0L0X3_TRIPR|nr:unnamed protein product [Trifolium pratense]